MRRVKGALNMQCRRGDIPSGAARANLALQATKLGWHAHGIARLHRRLPPVYKTSYDEGTLREKLFRRGPLLPDTHPAAGFRRNAGAVAEKPRATA